ncbi:hypothetical protein KAR91_65360 [Candidatus Pacearchaeota archaeon]|nr:hypothetical protein [Candidatus Pacearchaeota archaeon]
MGLRAKVIDILTGDENEIIAKIELYKDDNTNSTVFDSPGVDAKPLDNDWCFAENSENSEGGKDVLGFLDLKNAPIAEKGEHRTYSRNAAGETKNEIYQKKDGLVEIKNQVQTLSLLVAELFNELRLITTAGTAAAQAVDAATKTRLTTLENKYLQLFG